MYSERDTEFLYEKPLLDRNTVSEKTYQRMLDMVDLIKSKYSDFVSGLWYIDSRVGDTSFLLRTSFPAGDMREFEFGAEVGKIFDREATDDDAYTEFDFDTHLIKATDEQYEYMLGLLENAYVVYIKD